MHEREKYLIRKKLEKVPDLLKLLEKNDVILAGGAITSIFSEQPIRDFDLYFGDKDKITTVCKWFDKKMHRITQTARAVSYEYIRKKEKIYLKFQLITIPDTYDGHDNIFRRFDFTICMGAYYFECDKFAFHPEFFKHLAQRKLFFNPNTLYPINSLIRVKKYLARGYTISGSDLLKLGLTISNLKMDTLGDLKEQMEGIDTIFLKELTDALRDRSKERYDFDLAMELIQEYLNKYYDLEE